MGKTLRQKIDEAIEIIKNVKFDELELGRHDVNEDFYYNLQSYESKAFETTRYEAHRKYVDVQFIVEGMERIDIAPVSALEVEEDYQEEREALFLKAPERAASIVLNAGGYVVLYPEDAHRPCIAAGAPGSVKKIVGKVRI